ncbi:4Fe-4S ferredoxin [Thiohalorhabdus denitrificans]|uniref:4Fe-4S binding domain-containing protein n=1 Tax=Thiohalorhabdus denitrificans TaxID=381306 RepID=A0A0P9CMJ4_9GAMM|nr:4Fe-4S binding protein [Thiohalorhabdus denitrificans]KPV40298.1 4Fe-4S ferredoxin [Thiohalorhabdus denitrificans]SCX80737.1 4Fe-4S binding domain-containing protein [Thiohalorhabdus denitrificans]
MSRGEGILLRNLTVIRRLVQTLVVVFLLFGAGVVGPYAADKVSGAWPALTCAFDSQSGDYCALVPLQHQSTHRIGEAVVGGRDLATGALTMGLTLGTFLILFVLLNKAFCSWTCPLGYFQELLALLGQKVGLRQPEGLPAGAVHRTRPVKWIVLGLLVFGIPLLAGLGVSAGGFSNHAPYCEVCPSRFLTTLATADPSQIRVSLASPGAAFWTGSGLFLFGMMITLGMTLRQPFCRVCPMLALQAAFRRLGLLRLVKRPSSRCDKCGLCARACPMDIHEIQSSTRAGDATMADCTLCGRCVEMCPERDVLQLRYAGIKVFGADPVYFKARNRAQRRWEAASLVGWWRRRRAGEGRA